MTSALATLEFKLSWIRRVLAAFGGGYTRITFDDTQIKLDAAFGREPATAKVEQVERISFRRGRLNSRLTIVFRDDSDVSQTVDMSGLSVISGEDLLNAIDAAAATAASRFGTRLLEADQFAIRLLDGDRFVSQKEADDCHAALIVLAATAPAAYVRARMCFEAEQRLRKVQSLLDKKEFIAAWRAANREFIGKLVGHMAAEAYESALADLECQVNDHFAGDQYVYQHEAYLAHEEIEHILHEFPAGDMIERLSPSALGARDRLLPFSRLEALDARRLNANRYFTSALTVKAAAEGYNHAIESLDERVIELFQGESWLRASQAELRYEEVAGVVKEMPMTEIIEHMSPTATLARERLMRLAEVEQFEEARHEVNERFAAHASRPAVDAARALLRRELTEEQALAAVTDEDVTLVLAGAGSGKTAVIVGKVAHLVDNEGALPSEILVLAYNTKAVEELEARLAPKYGAVSVHTFHSFGKRIVDDGADVKASVSKLAADNDFRLKETEKKLREMLRDPVNGHALRHYLLYNRSPYRSPFEFDTPGEYYASVLAGERRSLNGDLMRSHEELQIANFLTLNGVSFEYERKYEQATANREYRQYEPDFWLPEYALYIEHFALDQDGRAPGDWPAAERQRYEKGVEWKRRVHADNKTTLLETFSWQRSEGSLRAELERQLLEHGVRLQPIGVDEIIKRLSDDFRATDVARLLDAFLSHQRSNNTTVEVLRGRAETAGDRERAAAFLDVFVDHQRWYIDALADDMDFHDMITKAASELREEHWRHPYKYVLVDEFQDISRGRMALLEALRRPGLAYFLVGDDWQSIYRFAGADVGLVNRVGKLLGTVRRRELGQTFRYGESILQASSKFVQQNPAQSQRELRPNEAARDDGIVVRALIPPEDGPAQRRLEEVRVRTPRARSEEEQKELKEAVEAAQLETVRHTLDIVLDDVETLTTAEERRQTVLLLGRYNRNNPGRITAKARLEFSTVHSAKGREADFVVVLDLKDGRSGFPSQREDDPLLDLVAPPWEPFSFAEERRLFYVALTRARRAVYLLVDTESQSRFVTELLAQDDGKIRRLGPLPADSAERCYRCKGGVLQPSISRKNMRCSNYPSCDALYPACRCGAGFVVHDGVVAKCTNPKCEEQSRPCPECRIGTLRRVEGDWGVFWGCSEYGRVPPCEYTQNIPPGR